MAAVKRLQHMGKVINRIGLHPVRPLAWAGHGLAIDERRRLDALPGSDVAIIDLRGWLPWI